MAGVGKRTYLRDVNPYLICPLCRGYLIDATTVVECLHSFCRSCILKHLNTEAHCPSCKHVLNKAKPNIKADKALQDIVYKLVPGLYHKEMRRRREFYKKHPEHADSATPEQRGEDVSGRLIFAPEDAVSLSLEYLPPGADPLTILLSTNDSDTHQSCVNNNNNNNNNNNGGNGASNRRYLQCPALVTIAHLKKFLALKYNVDMTRYSIEICHRRAPLPEHWTLMDVAYIYAWKRNAPMRFFYRVAQEEQRLEAPPHDRPSTPGLGASYPPAENPVSVDENANDENVAGDVVAKAEPDNVTISDKKVQNGDSDIPEEKAGQRVNDDRASVPEKVDSKDKIAGQLSNSTTSPSTVVGTTTTATTMTTTTTAAITTAAITTATTISTMAATVVSTTDTTTTTMMTEENNKQIKSPIKILKNPDGRYEVLKSPPPGWNASEQNSVGPGGKLSSPEFSVVSINDEQNSSRVKITLKQCSPGATSAKKPKVISNVLLRCGKMDKDLPGTLMIQQLQREKAQSADNKQEKQRRRVTFVERPISITTNAEAPKSAIKKSLDQPDKKQFLQGFQLAARESITEYVVPDSSCKVPTTKPNMPDINSALNSATNFVRKDGDGPRSNVPTHAKDSNEKSNAENSNVNTNVNPMDGNKRIGATNNVTGNVRGNSNKQHGNTDERMPGSTNANLSYSNANTNASNNHPSKVDVYAFPSDPPILPAGAVKRKCPPGLPIFEAKRRKQQAQSQSGKKQTTPVIAPATKSPRKPAMENAIPAKKPVNIITDPGPSRTICTANIKSPPTPLISNDTRNLLDGCGLNIPASLSITLTAPKSPGSNGTSAESVDSKESKKGVLGKVNPSITLNDRSVDPRVLKALKAGQIRMPAPAKPRPTKQVDREGTQQRATVAGKRKRDQETSRDILDLSGGKKIDVHPLRIPQPVSKLKPKPPVRDNLSSMADQGQVVTLMSGHRYYRAPPGSLTPAAHRVTDCPIPTPARTPVYAPTGFSSSLGNNRSNSNLSSVFPSLQSLYALSQAPNLQQFQMDARFKMPKVSDATSSTVGVTDSIATLTAVPSKSHVAAQCAPIKPARSSVAPLAVPIAKQQSNDRSISVSVSRSFGNDTNKISVFRGNETLDSIDSPTRTPVQPRCSPTIAESNSSRHSSPRSSTGSVPESNATDEVATVNASPPNRSVSTNNNASTPADNSGQQPTQPKQHQQSHEAASPRVSSTASPSPPPADANPSVNGDESGDRQADDNSVSNTSNVTGNDVPATSNESKSTSSPEVSSVKSPASPDSSSVAVDSPTTNKTCHVAERPASPAKTVDGKSAETATKPDSPPVDAVVADADKTKLPGKVVDGSQMTSEMLQKRLLAAFPTNEWASNPIAAEHLGNFLKSLNASMKADCRAEGSEAEKVEGKTANGDAKHIQSDVSSNTKKAIDEPT